MKLNLVSDELKKKIKMEQAYLMAKKLSVFLLIMSALWLLLIFAANFYLNSPLKIFIGQLEQLKSEQSDYYKKIRETNEKINLIAGIQDDFIAWSRFLERLSRETPAGVKLNLLKIDGKKEIVTMRGEALNRDDLLALQKNLTATGLFQEIDSPLSNILQKNEVNFEIKGKINLEKIRSL